jgi:hypothetical protein
MRLVDQLRKYQVALGSIAQSYHFIGTRFCLPQTFGDRSQSHIEMHQVPYFLAVNGTCATSSDYVKCRVRGDQQCNAIHLDGCLQQSGVRPPLSL